MLDDHSQIYSTMELLWDPQAESEAYSILEPKWKEEINKAGSFEFFVLPTNVHYNDFQKRKTVVLAYDGDELLYEGTVAAEPLDFYKQRKITCTGILSYLCDSIQAPDEKNAIEVPKSTTGKMYVPVSQARYKGANPKSEGWFEREFDERTGAIGYVKSKDTSANPDKAYFEETTGDGQNHSGKTLTKKAATSETIQDHISRILAVHNSQMDPFKNIHSGNINKEDNKKHDFKSANYRTSWDALESDITNEYGRYFRTRVGNDGKLKLDYVSLLEMSSSSSPVIEYSRNMLEMTEEDDGDDDIFTVLVPIGHNGLTVEKAKAPGGSPDDEGTGGSDTEDIGGEGGLEGEVTSTSNNSSTPSENKPTEDDEPDIQEKETEDHPGVDEMTGEITDENNGNNGEIDPYVAKFGGAKRYVVVSKAAIQRYGYIVRTVSFSDVKDATTLYNRAVEYIRNNYDYHKEYEVKAIDLKFLGESNRRIMIGDKCRIRSIWHEVDEQDLYVISAERDLMNPDNDVYKIGIPTSDREAKNKRLTSRTSDNGNKGGYAGHGSDINTLFEQLSEYIEVTEWGLEMHARLRNEKESDDQMYRTLFEQDEYHIRMMAQKIFGKGGDEDASGFMLVPASERNRGKHPDEEGWYEYGYDSVVRKNWYFLSRDHEDDLSKQYYTARLFSRISEIEVGPGGIRAVVMGNYETSTACAAWIEMNEDKILALLGHIFVDEDGNVIIDSGVGFKTGHKETRNANRYLLVPRSQYTKSPRAEGWYERKLDATGKWTGEGNPYPDDADFVPTSDTVANYSKYYYYKSTTTEEFIGEWGVWDQGNLTAGMIARMVNHPQYLPVPPYVLVGQNPSTYIYNNSGIYEYNRDTDSYGHTLDTTYDSQKQYYYLNNNYSESETTIKGHRIVIGPSDDYQGLPQSMKDRVDRYVAEHNLNGTITEIASDITTVNALFAEYIRTEYLESEFNELKYVCADTIFARQNVKSMGDIYINAGGKTSTDGVPVSNAVKMFGSATYNGDDVSIPYYNLTAVAAGGPYAATPAGYITFTKPASLGRVVWSNGEILDVYTLGDRLFFHADLNIPGIVGNSETTYARRGQSLEGAPTPLRNAPTIKYTAEVSGTWTDETHDAADDDPVVWTKDIYVNASKAYNDGWDQARLKMDWPPTMRGLIEQPTLTIKYPTDTVDEQGTTTFRLLDADTKGHTGYVRVYRDYQNDSNRGTLIGAIGVGDWYDAGWNAARLKMDWPSAMQGNGSRTSLTIKYPGYDVDSQSTTNFQLVDLDPKGSTGYIRLYRDYVDASHRGTLIGAIDVGDWYQAGMAAGGEGTLANLALIGPLSTTDTVTNPPQLNYDQLYTVYMTADGVQQGEKKYFKTPPDRYSDGYSAGWSGANAVVRTYSPLTIGGNEITDGNTINLGFGGSTVVRAQYKEEGQSAYSNRTGITVKAAGISSFGTSVQVLNSSGVSSYESIDSSNIYWAIINDKNNDPKKYVYITVTANSSYGGGVSKTYRISLDGMANRLAPSLQYTNNETPSENSDPIEGGE